MKLLKLLEDLKINVQGNLVQMEWSHPSKELVGMLFHDAGGGDK